MFWDASVRSVDRRLVYKRCFDVIVGALAVVATTPIVVVLAAISWVTYREWPFFTQRRLGRHGDPFTMVKIRTMPSSANPYALKHDLDASAIPPIMQLLRRLHLDELPQLWLVLRGRMSLVGPRPRMPDEFEPVSSIYDDARTRVPQGCTCLWQIGDHTGGLPSQAPEYDLWYLRHGGIRLDLWILFWTALVMIGLAEPKGLRDVPRPFQSRGWLRCRTEQAGSGDPGTVGSGPVEVVAGPPDPEVGTAPVSGEFGAEPDGLGGLAS
ncbi:sugar transferase [Salsipaludibacter albus]|uniref:sugar transferase n=1 Tax=Salsipaludibacter albus TaxID=2849650 RepID=UPI001EE3CFE0|nr:sugar transferase [Salsipaludibacter albus]